MSNKTYDRLKWLAMYFLPALGTLYFALAGIWGLPYGEQLVGTITAIDTFLGVILGISKSKYNKCSHQQLHTRAYLKTRELLQADRAGRSSFYAAMYLKKLSVTGFPVKSTIFIFLFVQVCSKI